MRAKEQKQLNRPEVKKKKKLFLNSYYKKMLNFTLNGYRNIFQVNGK